MSLGGIRDSSSSVDVRCPSSWQSLQREVASLASVNETIAKTYDLFETATDEILDLVKNISQRTEALDQIPLKKVGLRQFFAPLDRIHAVECRSELYKG